MKTMMMLLVIAISACGVEQVGTEDRRQDSPLTAGYEDQRGAQPLANDEQAPQPCELTTDCAIGVCDLDAKVCIGDNSWRTDADEVAGSHRQP